MSASKASRRDDGILEEGEAYSSRDSEFKSENIQADVDMSDASSKFPLFIELSISGKNGLERGGARLSKDQI